MSHRSRHRNSFKPAPLPRPKKPARRRALVEATPAFDDENIKRWSKRYMYCCLLSEKIRMDLFRESLISGKESAYKQYMAISEGEYAAAKDPRYPYIHPQATNEERDEFWTKFDQLTSCYPETAYDKAMHFAVCTFGAQWITLVELQHYNFVLLAQLITEGSRKAREVLMSQGWMGQVGEYEGRGKVVRNVHGAWSDRL